MSWTGMVRGQKAWRDVLPATKVRKRAQPDRPALAVLDDHSLRQITVADGTWGGRPKPRIGCEVKHVEYQLVKQLVARCKIRDGAYKCVVPQYEYYKMYYSLGLLRPAATSILKSAGFVLATGPKNSLLVSGSLDVLENAKALYGHDRT